MPLARQPPPEKSGASPPGSRLPASLPISPLRPPVSRRRPAAGRPLPTLLCPAEDAGVFRCQRQGWPPPKARRLGTPTKDPSRADVEKTGARPWASTNTLMHCPAGDCVSILPRGARPPRVETKGKHRPSSDASMPNCRPSWRASMRPAPGCRPRTSIAENCGSSGTGRYGRHPAPVRSRGLRPFEPDLVPGPISGRLSLYRHQFQDEQASDHRAYDLEFCAWARAEMQAGATVIYSCWS